MKNKLELIPLSLTQLKLYLANDFSLEKEFNLNPVPRSVSSDLAEALANTIIPAVEASGQDIFFSTLWTIIDRDQNVMVGDCCFYGQPDENGETEIGYGTYSSFRNQGYMTEAVRLLINIAKKHKELRSIKASTYKNNPASAAVLVKNRFIPAGESNDLLYWKFSIL
jgi:[ribosomal protein S5]-alanine N-acetyltransferase